MSGLVKFKRASIPYPSITMSTNNIGKDEYEYLVRGIKEVIKIRESETNVCLLHPDELCNVWLSYSNKYRIQDGEDVGFKINYKGWDIIVKEIRGEPEVIKE